MSDTTPTTGPPPTSNADIAVPSSRPPLGVLVAIGALLLVIVMLVIAIVRMSSEAESPTATPTESESVSPTPTESVSASPTPTPTPTASPTASPAPTPEPTSVPTPSATATAGPLPIEIAKFISFVAPRITTCIAGESDVDEYVPLVAVAWNSTGAVEAWFAEGDDDAADVALMQVPLQGDEEDFTEAQYFACGEPYNKYTLTLVADDGTHVSKTWTVVNKGDVFTPEPR